MIGMLNRLMLLENLVLGCIFFGMILLPFSSGIENGGVVVSFCIPVFFIAALLFFIEISLKGLKFDKKLYIPIVLMALFSIWIFISIFFSNDIMASGKRAFDVLLGFFMFLYILSRCNYTDRVINFFNSIGNALIVFGIVLSGYYLINFFFCAIDYGMKNVLLSREVGGLSSLPWGATNTIAAIFIFCIYISMFFLIVTNKKKYMFYCVLFLSVMALTFSRTALMLVMVSLVLSAFLTKKYKPLILMLIISGVLAVIYLIIPTIFQYRLQNLLEFSGRLDIWSMYLSQVGNYLFYPSGYFSLISRFGYSAHNFILTTFVEQGVIGVILSISVYCYGGWFLFKEYLCVNSLMAKKAFMFLLIGFLFSFVNLQFEDANFTTQYVFVFWFYLALIYMSPYYLQALGERKHA